jgi:PilZ domain-containing protein
MHNSPEQSQDHDENRSEFRRRTLKGGKIVFNDQKSVLDCTIRNLSETGCQIIVTNNIDIPKAFELHLASSGEKYQCEIIWRKANEAGVKFKSWYGIS